MNKKYKLLTAMSSALILALSLSIGASAQNTVLSEDSSLTVQCTGDNVVLLEFVPESSGPYVISSRGNVDTKAALYSEAGYNNGYSLTEDDDGGKDRNFELLAILNEGEKYYIETCVVDDGGQFDIVARRMKTLSIGSPVTVTLNESTPNEWISFKPTANGAYTIYSQSTGVDPLCIVWDQYGQQIGYNDDGENGLEFSVGCGMNAGTTYFLNVSQYGKDEGQVKVSVQRFTDGWVLEGGVWAYYENGERSGRGWKQNGDSWCYLGNDGYAITDQWKRDTVGDVYLDETGLMAKNRLVESSIGTYYVNDKGYCVKNTWMLLEEKGDWVYFGVDGKMATSKWLSDSNGPCYVGADGCMVRNSWVKNGSEWCYLDSSGRITKNRWVKDSVGWCYVGNDGYCVKNTWKRDSIGWCYLDSSGRMATNRWVQDSVGWCYVGSNGYAVTNCWMRDSIGWCYLDSNGSMMKSQWLNDGGKWYYLDSNGYMVTGTVTIGGRSYTFNSSGVWVG